MDVQEITGLHAISSLYLLTCSESTPKVHHAARMPFMSMLQPPEGYYDAVLLTQSYRSCPHFIPTDVVNCHLVYQHQCSQNHQNQY